MGILTLATDPGMCTADYKYTPPVAEDNCLATVVRTQSPSINPDILPLGASMVEYTATDLEGNSASCSFDMLVEDRETPVIVCPAPII
jgi:large repetitive protein